MGTVTTKNFHGRQETIKQQKNKEEGMKMKNLTRSDIFEIAAQLSVVFVIIGAVLVS